MSINYFAFAVNQARQMAANKVLGTPSQQASDWDHEQFEDARRRGEPDHDLCAVCGAHEKGVEDDTCGSMTCRETYWSEFYERM